MDRLVLLKKYELSFHPFGYKLMDAKLLIEFICNHKDCILKSEEIKWNYGGDPLRYGSLIIEFEQCGLIEVVKQNFLGNTLEFRYSNTLWTKDLLSQK